MTGVRCYFLWLYNVASNINCCPGF